jgi:hypothetical protein
MIRISRFATALGLATLKVRQDEDLGPALCHSYGMDFQSNGYYFQDSMSSDNFTFVEQFEGILRSCSDRIRSLTFRRL